MLLYYSSVPGIFAKEQGQYMELIKQMLMSCLRDNTEVGNFLCRFVRQECDDGSQCLALVLPGVLRNGCLLHLLIG